MIGNRNNKITNELMSFSYTYLNNMKIVALRFFSVYGPWGRPDMAVYKFCEAISKKKKIELYNNGNNFRDYTYISDVVDGVIKTFKYIKKTNTYCFKKNWTHCFPSKIRTVHPIYGKFSGSHIPSMHGMSYQFHHHILKIVEMRAV